MAIDISIPPEDNAAISIYSHLALALQRFEEDEVQNIEKTEQMIIRYGEFSTMMQHQEKNEAQKFM